MSKQSPMSDHQTFDGMVVQIGMSLVDKDGSFIGAVKEVKDECFLVDRSIIDYQDLFVPYWICFDNGSGQIKVEITLTKINQSILSSPERVN